MRRGRHFRALKNAVIGAAGVEPQPLMAARYGWPALFSTPVPAGKARERAISNWSG